MAERLKASVLKTDIQLLYHRFESCLIRSFVTFKLFRQQMFCFLGVLGTGLVGGVLSKFYSVVSLNPLVSLRIDSAILWNLVASDWPVSLATNLFVVIEALGAYCDILVFEPSQIPATFFDLILLGGCGVLGIWCYGVLFTLNWVPRLGSLVLGEFFTLIIGGLFVLFILVLIQSFTTDIFTWTDYAFDDQAASESILDQFTSGMHSRFIASGLVLGFLFVLTTFYGTLPQRLTVYTLIFLLITLGLGYVAVGVYYLSVLELSRFFFFLITEYV